MSEDIEKENTIIKVYLVYLALFIIGFILVRMDGVWNIIGIIFYCFAAFILGDRYPEGNNKKLVTYLTVIGSVIISYIVNGMILISRGEYFAPIGSALLYGFIGLICLAALSSAIQDKIRFGKK